MVHLNTILESLVTVCKQSGQIPEEVTYATVALDGDGEHKDVSPPVIEFSVDSVDRDTSRNTERVGLEFDDAGNEIGYIYRPWFDAVVNAEVLSVSGTQYNHRELEQQLRLALYRYDKRGVGEQIPDPSDTTSGLRGVSWVRVDSIQPDRDFSTSPTVRTRNSSISVGFEHEISTSDLGIEYDTVEDVDFDLSVVFSDDGDSETESYSTS